MASESLNGIVLSYSDYRDNDRILTLLTIEKGRVDCKVRNCRKPTAPFLACSQLFVYGEYTIFSTKQRTTLNSCEIKETFFPIREDPDRFMIGSVILKLSLSAAEADVQNQSLFSLLYYSLSYLAYSEVNPTDLLCGFLVKYLDILGYRPTLTNCAVCHKDVRNDDVLFYSPSAGGTVCVSCPHGGSPVNKTALEAIRRMTLLSDQDIKRIKMPESLQKDVLTLLNSSLEEILGADDKSVQYLYQFID